VLECSRDWESLRIAPAVTDEQSTDSRALGTILERDTHTRDRDIDIDIDIDIIMADTAFELVVVQQPGQVTKGELISEVIVEVHDLDGNLVYDYDQECEVMAVRVSESDTMYDEPIVNPDGEVSILGVNGSFSFSTLSLSATGTFVLRFQAPNAAPADSMAFRVIDDRMATFDEDDDPLKDRVCSRFLTKYERARLIGTRATQIRYAHMRISLTRLLLTKRVPISLISLAIAVVR